MNPKDENPAPTFLPQEAQALINTARSAPTMNMDHADRTRILLERFVRWYESVTRVAE